MSLKLSGFKDIYFYRELHLYQLILSATQANLLCVLKTAFPVGIRMDMLEQFIMAVLMAASARARFLFSPSVDYWGFIYQICTSLIQGYWIK